MVPPAPVATSDSLIPYILAAICAEWRRATVRPLSRSREGRARGSLPTGCTRQPAHWLHAAACPLVARGSLPTGGMRQPAHWWHAAAPLRPRHSPVQPQAAVGKQTSRECPSWPQHIAATRPPWAHLQVSICDFLREVGHPDGVLLVPPYAHHVAACLPPLHAGPHTGGDVAAWLGACGGRCAPACTHAALIGGCQCFPKQTCPQERGPHQRMSQGSGV
jgi:hypothetical protein